MHRSARNGPRTVDGTGLGRLAALKQLVTDVPAPVLGELIGYSPRIVARHAVDQASTGTTTPGSKLGMDNTDNEKHAGVDNVSPPIE